MWFGALDGFLANISEAFSCCYLQYQPKFRARALGSNIGFTMSCSTGSTMKPPACKYLQVNPSNPSTTIEPHRRITTKTYISLEYGLSLLTMGQSSNLCRPPIAHSIRPPNCILPPCIFHQERWAQFSKNSFHNPPIIEFPQKMTKHDTLSQYPLYIYIS